MAEPSNPREADYQRLKNIEGLLTATPALRKKLEGLVREADPNAKVPFLEQQEAVENLVKERTSKLEEELKEIKERTARREYDEDSARTITRLRRAPFNLDEEDIKAVKELVAAKYKEGEVLSLETAARFYIAQHSPVVGSNPVRTPFSTRLARPKNDFRKELRNPKSRLFTDPRGYINEQFDQAWEEGLEMINSQGQ
jgi:hypothetical protein